jgi:Zn-dependent peptidase ImmA (M78 family)
MMEVMNDDRVRKNLKEGWPVSMQATYRRLYNIKMITTGWDSWDENQT